MAEQLEIVIGANVDDAKAGVKSLSDVINDFARQGKLSIGVVEQSLVELRQIIKQTTNPEDLQKLNTAFAALQQKLVQLKNDAGLQQNLGGISRSARLAHSDIDQLGRSLALFAQGNERGVDTISNLLFTFQRLEGTTGGAKAALAELVEVFTGPAGIAIAVSTAINLFAPFIEEIFKSTEAVESNKKALDAISDSITTVKDNVDSLTKAFQFFNQLGAINVKVSGLGTLQDLREQNVAQRQLIQDFRDQEIAARALAESAKDAREQVEGVFQASGKKTSDATLAQRKENLEQAKKVEEQANEELKRIINERIAAERGLTIIEADQRATRADNERNAIKASQALRDQEIENIKATIARAKSAADALGTAFIIPLDDRIAANALRETNDFYRKLIEQRERLVLSLKAIDVNTAISGIDKTKLEAPIELQIFQIDKKLLAEDFAAAKKFLHDQAIGFKIALPVDITLPKAIPEQEKADFKKSIDELLKKVSAPLKLAIQTPSLQEDIDNLRKKLEETIKFDPKNITDSLNGVKQLILNDKELADILKLSLTLHADPVQMAKAVNEIKEFLPKSLKGKLDISIESGDIDTTGLLQDLAKLNKDASAALRDTLIQIGTDLGTLVGQTIGDALTGGDIGKAFQQFGQAVGSAVEALGKQFIALGIAALLAKRSIQVLFANPAFAIAAGIALVAVGEALRNLLGQGLQGFAKGGRPPVGEWVIVGERGPELFKADQPGRIYSNSQSKSLLSSSVKENNEVREYVIASRISQQLKEHFSSAFKSIETTVKAISASHDKLIHYSYKLHESISSLKETSTDKQYYNTVTSAIEKTNNNYESLSASLKLISERPSATIDNSSHYEKSFDAITASIEKIATSDRSVTIERIINNNFYSSEVKDSFKSMSLTDIQRTFHIPAFAQGGAVFGPTLAILGEGFGVSRSNPEFVGTASQLKGIQGGQFDINVSVDGELSFSMGKLAVALNREVRSQLRTSGKNPF